MPEFLSSSSLSATPLLGVASWVRPLWIPVAGLGGALLLWYLVGALLRAVTPRVAAVAGATAREGLRQPLFLVELLAGVLLLFVFTLLPGNTFGEDIKLLKDSGLTMVLVLGLLLSAWTASVSVADELEGRTALTVLSKPVARRAFLLGKFLGVLQPVLLLFLLLGAVFLMCVSFKVTFDIREHALIQPSPEQSQREMLQVLPGLVLALLETVVLTSVVVALATRLSMVPNLVLMLAIYVVGHLAPLLVQSSAGQHEIVAFVGQLLAAVLPVLDHYSVQAAVSTGRPIPWDYVAWAGGYTLIYCSVAMLVALVFFEDRDLA